MTRAGAVALADLLPAGIAFSADSVDYLARIFGLYRRPFDIRLAIANVDPSVLVSDHAPVEVLEFNGDLRVDAGTEAVLTVRRPGRVDGLLLWIQLWCLPDDEPVDSLHMRTSWIPAYVPLFWPPHDVAPGDELRVAVRHRLSDDRVHPDYHVDAELRSCAGRHTGRHTAAHHPERFRADPLYRWLFPAPGAAEPDPAR